MLRNFCNSLAKQTKLRQAWNGVFPHQAKTKPPCRPATYSYREIYAIVERVHRRQPAFAYSTAIKTTASIMMMNGTAVNGVNQLRTAGGTTLTRAIYKVSNRNRRTSTSAAPGRYAPKR